MIGGQQDAARLWNTGIRWNFLYYCDLCRLGLRRELRPLIKRDRRGASMQAIISSDFNGPAADKNIPPNE